ncbi:S1 family peptidase [Streptomyces luteireticuli]|uniref:S1 family peptidase n=1 Tax=Streptomyces luteireticuli TaxID=173858 RepID=UPI0031DDE10F
MTGTPASAIVGDEAKEGQYRFTAKIDIGGGRRSCTGALVESQWVLTAASCFADDPSQGSRIPGGAPKQKTTVTIGRTDLTRETGTVVDAVELVPRGDRDLVLVKLKDSVAGIVPVPLSRTEPRQGDELRVTGYGRTKDEWAPERLHYATFGIDAVSSGSIGLAGRSGGASLCMGDAGGPAFREMNGAFELAAVNTASWQGGCFGADEAESRTGVTSSRVDDIADWIQQTFARTLLKRSDWKNAQHIVPGYFTGGSPGGRRHMDLFVAWKNGSASLFQGADDDDPKYPFTAEHKISGSGWQYAVSVAGGDFTGNGSDGLVVRWQTGEVTWFSHVSQNGFSKEQQLRPANDTWVKYAKAMTVGRYTANAQRDDLLVVWVDGSISLFADLGANGLKREVQLLEKTQAGTYIEQISAGEFTGKSTADLLVRWRNGSASIFAGVSTTNKFRDEIRIRDEKSAWQNSETIAAGSFVGNARPNDVLVRWADGNFSLYPATDEKGTHGEVELLKQ